MTAVSGAPAPLVPPRPPAGGAGGLPLLRLLQLASPQLPVGAFAWSSGLEGAVEAGWVQDDAGLGDWLAGLLGGPWAHQDLPALARLHAAWTLGDAVAVAHWNDWLSATRETAELRAEDRALGRALARLLATLDLPEAAAWAGAEAHTGYATMFALAAARWGVPVEATLQALAWAWVENQVVAATRLMPLGQSAAQRRLAALMPDIEAAVALALALEDDELGCSAAGLALASCRHETQYTRLFRS